MRNPLENNSFQQLFGHAPFPVACLRVHRNDYAMSRAIYFNRAWAEAFPTKLEASLSEFLFYITGSTAESREILNQLQNQDSITRYIFNIRNSSQYVLNFWHKGEDTFYLSIHPLTLNKDKDFHSSLTYNRWKALLNLLPDMVFVLNASCQFVDVYAADKRDLILPADVFLGKFCEEVLPPDLASLTRKNVQKVVASRQMVIDEYSIDIHGETKYFESRYIYVSEDELLSIVRDITPRKIAEAKAQIALNIQEKILELALEHIHIEPSDIENRMSSLLPNLSKELAADKAWVYLLDFQGQSIPKVWQWKFDEHQNILQSFSNRVLNNISLLLDVSSIGKGVIELTQSPENDYWDEFLICSGVSSLVLTPLNLDKGITGILGFASCSNKKWEDYAKELVLLMGKLIENVLKHYQIFSQLLESEQRNKKLQELFRSIADNMEDMLWAKDMNKQFIFVNKAICEKLLNARDIEEPIGKTDLFFAERERLSHPENPRYHTFGEICRDSDQVVIDTRKPGRFDEFGNVQGKFLYLDVIKTPIFDEKGNMIAVVGSARNVTKEKRLEDVRNLQFELLEAASRLEGLHDFLTFVLDRMVGFFKVNNIYIARADFRNNEFMELASVDEKDNISVWPIQGSLSGYLLRQGKSLLLNQHEISVLVQQGEIEVFGTPAASWMGSVLEVENQQLGVIVVQDYTHEHKFSGDDLKLLDALSKILGLVIYRKEQQKRLQEAFEKLKESDLLKEQLLQNMSHELRTPLNGILGFSSLLADEHVEPHLIKSYAHDIYESGSRLLNLVTDLLDLTVFETQEIPCEFSVFSVHEILRALEDEFLRLAQKKGLTFLANYKQKPDILIETDYEKLRRILWNLISNALKFTHRGHVSLNFEMHEGSISFRVEDTGVGIARELREKIFDKFYQADMRINRSFEGAGLGLALVKILTHFLHGEIIVDSEPGQGSVFELRIPVKFHEPSEHMPDIQVDTSLLQRRSRKILIVEDDSMNQDLYKIYFESKGFHVECKGSGSEAIELFTLSSDFDLVIMDIKLPDIDGYTLTQRLKEIKQEIRLVVISAYTTAQDRLKAIEAGADEFIPKPLRVNDLKELLRKFHL